MPPPDRQSLTAHDPKIICDHINTSCSMFSVKALFVATTNARNLVIAFDYKSTEKNIQNAAATIKSVVAPGCTEATFSKNLSWSRLAIPRVPCQKPFADDMDVDAITTKGNLYSSKEIEDALRSSHHLFSKAVFTMAPDWAGQPESVKTSTLATISLAMEDPDGSIAEELSRSWIPLFGTRVYPRGWKEKIDMKQCQKCWGFVTGMPHTKCRETCITCASTSHLSAKFYFDF